MPKGIYKRTKPGSFKGKKHTKETKNKMSESWDYDKHITKGFREKLSRANSGKNNPMYGKPITDEHRKHLVESHVGQIAWNKGKRFPQVTGNKNGNWKGGVTPEIHKRLNDFKWLRIINEIRERDNFTCQLCGKKNHILDIHHIIPYRITQNNNPKNLISLCKSCHAKIDNKINIIFILYLILKIARKCNFIPKIVI